MESVLLDAAGHRRSPATMPGYHQGRSPRNKGELYPADPPTVEEIVAVMRSIGDGREGHRLRALIVLLWRAGLRISEALSVHESDLDRSRGAVLVRRGKGGKRREVGMDRWAWERLEPWLEVRRELPVGAVLCVIHGPTAGRRWEASAARKQLHHAAARAGVRRRFAPHQLRHAHAVEMAHEGVPLVVIQRQLGHANLGITSIYLQGIDSSEIISTVHVGPRRRSPQTLGSSLGGKSGRDWIGQAPGLTDPGGTRRWRGAGAADSRLGGACVCDSCASGASADRADVAHWIRRMAGRVLGVTFSIVLPDHLEWKTRPHEPGEPARHVAELQGLVGFEHSRANIWRYEPSARGRRHVHTDQEETFVVLAGCLTMFLGEPPQRRIIPVGGIVHVPGGTPLQTVNEADEDLVVYAYGSPPDEGAKVLPSAV